MLINIDLKNILTLAKLREIVNDDLSKFDDDTPINICVLESPYNTNTINNDIEVKDSIKGIVGKENDITFYNYI